MNPVYNETIVLEPFDSTRTEPYRCVELETKEDEVVRNIV